MDTAKDRRQGAPRTKIRGVWRALLGARAPALRCLGSRYSVRPARRRLRNSDADSLVQPASLAIGHAQDVTCALAFQKKLWGRRLARGHLRSDDHDESTHDECVIHARFFERANCPQANGSQKRANWRARCSGPPGSGDKGWNTSIRNLRKDFKMGEPLSRRLFDGSIRPWEARPIVEAQLDKKPKQTETWIHDVATGTERVACAKEVQRFRPWQEDPNDHSILQGRVSPDGKLLAFTEYVDDPRKSTHAVTPLFVRALSGGKAIELTPGTNFVGEFWWNAKSSEIFFVESPGDGRPARLSVIAADGGEPRQVFHFEDSLFGF